MIVRTDAGPLDILVTLNGAYLPRLQVLLASLHDNQPGRVDVHLIHRGIEAEDLAAVDGQCRLYGYGFEPLEIDGSLFDDAPVSRQYPQEMYHRLLAPALLPPGLHRVLYIDPDTLVINPLDDLWNLDLEGKAFAAAAHTGTAELANNLNQTRLGTDGAYFNSGVILMDLDRCRTLVDIDDVFGYVRRHASSLVLPDQDVFNALYGQYTMPVDDVRWNYDARNYHVYLLRSSGQHNLDWVMAHTSVLHFCGRLKPWRARYRYRFGVLYKHYVQRARRTGLYLD